MTIERFEKEVKEKNVAVVDFYATWCGPCKALAPKIEQVQSEMPDIKFMKVDIEENDVISSEYGIKSVPTLLFFKNGELSDMVLGNVNKSEITDRIKKLM